MRYAVITPARNEGELIQFTIESMFAQTVKPVVWLILDDGSTDSTCEVLSDFEKKVDWVKLIRLKDRGYYYRGTGVVQAFEVGLRYLSEYKDLDLVAKVDADVSFEPHYFEKIIDAFKQNPELGISGGTIYEVKRGEWKPAEQLPLDMVQGANKVYRMDCLQSIGGLVPHAGWDAIDNIKGALAGWDVQRFKELIVKHYRMTGAREGFFRGSYLEGKKAYFMGSDHLFLMARAFYRSTRVSPYVLSGVAMLLGYLETAFRGKERFGDARVTGYFRQRTRRMLLEGQFRW